MWGESALKSGIRIGVALGSVLVLLLPTSALFLAMFPYEGTLFIVLWLLVVVLPALLWVNFHSCSLERLAVFAIAVWVVFFISIIPIQTIQRILQSVGLLPRSSLLVVGASLTVIYCIAYVAVYRGGYERVKEWVMS